MELPPNNIRAIPELSKFKLAISDLKFDADCYTFQLWLILSNFILISQFINTFLIRPLF